MEVIVGEFGIVVVPRDGADPDRIMNHSSILRKYKVSGCQHGWEGCKGTRSLSLRRAVLLPQGTEHLKARCSQLLGGTSNGATARQPPEASGVGRLAGQMPTFRLALHSSLPPSPAEQHSGGEG